MKTKPQGLLLSKVLIMTCAAGLMISHLSCANEKSITSDSLSATGGGPDMAKAAEKNKDKKRFLRKKSSVKVYKENKKQNIHVVTNKKDRKEVDFFLFDLEGTLVQNYRMKANDQVKITGMKKGTYIYRVFCGDEETSAGQIEIN